jgi:protein O-GlcNAc transferase
MSAPAGAAGARVSLDQAFELAQSHHAAGRMAQAEAIYLKILEAVPDHPRAHYLLGLLSLQLGHAQRAEQRFRTVLRMRPHNVEALTGLASAHHKLGRFNDALQSAQRALSLDSRCALAHGALGRALLSTGQHAAATASYRQAVALAPEDAPLFTALLYCMAQDEQTDPDELTRLHRRFGQKFGSNLPERHQPHDNLRDPERRLRVGFVSADLHHHAVAYFIEPVWRELDRAEVEVFAYSNRAVEDEVACRLKALADQWRQVSTLDDASLARLVRSDEIDILIDLSGHTVGNRLLAFARKPAPVQASWIGYPETTGLTAVDYYLADPFSAPWGLIDERYVEKLVRLPASVAFQPDAQAPDVNPRPALASGFVTFGSFNRTSKLGATVIDTWAALLRALPDARLLLADVGDAAQEADLKARFTAQGIAAERLRCVPRLPREQYLALHHEVDVLLDTFPYTGGTTTQHALWMGVPVVTLAGTRRTERIGTANLMRVGLGDWSVTSRQAYVERALAAAADLPGLAALRAGLRERIAGSPLRRADVVARSLEIAFRRMWRTWCEGQASQAFEVALDDALADAAQRRS